jgi:hypothetical protein
MGLKYTFHKRQNKFTQTLVARTTGQDSRRNIIRIDFYVRTSRENLLADIVERQK